MANEAGAVFRSELLHQLAASWGHDHANFLALMDRIATLDLNEHKESAIARQSSIALERLLDGTVKDAAAADLQKICRDHGGLDWAFYQLFASYVSGPPSEVSQHWGKIAEQARGRLSLAARIIPVLGGEQTFSSTDRAVDLSLIHI